MFCNPKWKQAVFVLYYLLLTIFVSFLMNNRNEINTGYMVRLEIWERDTDQGDYILYAVNDP